MYMYKCIHLAINYVYTYMNICRYVAAPNFNPRRGFPLLQVDILCTRVHIDIFCTRIHIDIVCPNIHIHMDILCTRIHIHILRTSIHIDFLCTRIRMNILRMCTCNTERLRAKGSTTSGVNNQKIVSKVSCLPVARGGGLGSSTIFKNLMSPTPRRKWYLTTGRRAH